MKLKIIQSIEEFEQLEKIWNVLLEKSYTSTFFQTFEWNYFWTKNFISSKAIWILLAKKDNEIVGIAPLFLATSKGILFRKILKFMGDPISDYSDFIVHKAHKKEVLDLFLNFFKKINYKLDSLRFAEVPEASFTLEYFQKKQPQALISPIGKTHQYIPIGDTWEEKRKNFFKIKRKILRSNHILKKNLHSKKGKFIFSHSSKNFQPLFENLVFYHKSRWKDTRTPSLFEEKKYLHLYTELFENLLKKKKVLLVGLEVENQIVAVLSQFHQKQTTYFNLISYNQDFLHFAPGHGVILASLEYALENKVEVCDFLRGDQSYKGRYVNHSSTNYEIEIVKDPFKRFFRKKKRAFILWILQQEKLLSIIKKW